MLIDFQEPYPQVDPIAFPDKVVLSVLEPAHLSFKGRTASMTSVEQVGAPYHEKFLATFELDESLYVRRSQSRFEHEGSHYLDMAGKFLLRGRCWVNNSSLMGVFEEVVYEITFSGRSSYNPNEDPSNNYNDTQVAVGKPTGDSLFVVKLAPRSVRNPDVRYERTVEPA